MRWRASAVLAAILFVVPWIRIGGEPLVLLDIAARRFHVAGLVIFPQELYLLWVLVIGLAILLFFVTSIAGRLWCGWACPQTVFTDAFAAIGRFVEGWRGHSRPRKVATWRKVVLHGVWLAACIAIGFHLVAYFRSPYVMLGEIGSGQLSSTTAGLWLFATAISYVDFVFVRQTFCKYLCPYARFQSVMFDRDTLIIGYDEPRGEPRGKRAKADTPGDCIDCGLCVQVCPTEIDIRDGLQLGCIACAQCIDACDGVMDRLGREPSLIGYRALESESPRRLLRPRVVIYGALLGGLAIVFASLLAVRKPVDFEIVRNRDSLYSTAADGRTGNSYTLRIQNRSRSGRSFYVALLGADGEPLGDDAEYELIAGMNPIAVDATDDAEAQVFVLGRRGDELGTRAREIRFSVQPIDDATVRIVRTARFISGRSS